MRNLIAAILALPLFALASGAVAQDRQAGQIDQAVVDRAVNYLNSIRTLQARFIQRDLEGHKWTGEMWMERPGRIRFQYDPPEGDVIWSDDNLVKHYDAELETMTHVPQSATPAWFLLDDPVRVTGDVEILAAEATAERYFVAAAKTDALSSGHVTLAFQKSPDRLLGWSVTEGDGTVTQVDLLDAKFDLPIDHNLFRYEPPKRR